jgi:hypothetical protein
MRNYSQYLLTIIFISVMALVNGQDFHGGNNNALKEKILVFTDKQDYLAGEVLWFKITVTAQTGSLAPRLSNSVYAELRDSAGIVLHSKLLLKDNFCSGAFELPDNLPSGVYTLKTYTGAMKNSSPELYFQKKITVGNFLATNKNIDALPIGQDDSTTGSLLISLSPGKSSYTGREKISVAIAAKKASGIFVPIALSLSVYQLDSTFTEDHSVGTQVQNAFGAGTQLYRQATPFYGKAEEVYNLDSYTRFSTMEELFREYIKGVGVGVNNKKHRLFIYDDITRMPLHNNPFVIIDGTPVTDMEKLMAIDPLKIKTISVVTRKYFFGKDVFDGIIDLQSYVGDYAGYEPEENSGFLSYETVQPQRIFDHPSYTTPAQKASRHPDFRSTLFWDPNVQAGSNGEQKIEFYTSDVKGKFMVVARAVDADGETGGSSAIVSVE